MWTPIQINGECFLFMCNVGAFNQVNYYLSDLKRIWSETCSLDDALSRAKELNKRIEFDNETVVNTIKSQPESINIEHVQEGANHFCKVHVKYNVLDYPFNFKWKLKLCPQDEFLHRITNPLLLTLSCLTKKNSDLLEIIRKKDIEINQYVQEGAVLKRSKVVTEPFNEDNFNAKYPKVKTHEFIKYSNDNFDNLKKDCIELIESTAVNDNNSPSSKSTTTVQSKSPKAAKHARFVRNLKKQKLLSTQSGKVNYDYDDSDSCTPPSNIEKEITDIHRSLEELKRKQLESVDDQTSTTSQITQKKRKRLNL